MFTRGRDISGRAPRVVVVLIAVVVLTLGVGAFAIPQISARRAWSELRPSIAPSDGVHGPGFDERIAACSARLAHWPPDRGALVEFTMLCHANGQLEAAIRGCEALMRLEPHEPRWPHLLASIHAGYGRLGDALPLLRRTVALAPDNAVAWLLLGDALLKTDALAEAEKSYDEALRCDAENKFALLGLARCALQAERWTAARGLLQRAATKDPEFAPALHLLATVHERLGNPEAAAIALERAQHGLTPGAAVDAWLDELTSYCHDIYRLLVVASTELGAGSPKRAHAQLDRALVVAPDDPRVRAWLDQVLKRGGGAAVLNEFQQTYDRRFGAALP